MTIVGNDHRFGRKLKVALSVPGEFILTGSYSRAQAAVKLVPSRTPDLLLVDVELPDRRGVECARQLHASVPHLPIIMLADRADAATLFEAVQSAKRCDRPSEKKRPASRNP